MSSEKKNEHESHSVNKKSAWEQWSPKVMPYVPYLLVFLVMCLIYSHLFSKQLLNNEPAISLCMRALLFVFVLYGAYLLYADKLTMDRLIMLCILGGLVMRMGYTFYTPFTIRAHDLGEVSLEGTGHATYIYNLFENNKLPDSYDYQFYHPPFFHFLAAGFMKFFAKLHPEADIMALFEASKLVSCFASCSILLLLPSLCRELKCKPEMTCIIVAIVSFCPNFYLLAGRVNNDSVAVVLMMFSVLMLVKWYHSRKFIHLIAMAAGIGFGMMTKLNVAVLAFVAGPVMLYVLWQAFREKKWKGLFGQYCIFIAVCAPLGLWYSFRNYIRFEMPFGYVLNLDPEGTGWLYRGNLSFAKRFLSFPWDEFIATPYCNPGSDYNLPMYIVRCSMFGEFQYQNMDSAALRLVFINLILIILSIVAMIVVILKGKKFDPMLRYGGVMFWLVIMASYVMFNVKYPESCTMDFRYIVPVVICGAVYLAAFWQMLRDYLTAQDAADGSHPLQKKRTAKYYTAKVMVCLIPFCCVLYVLFSAYMFANLS